nr:type VII secretion system-associated protein [Actinoplanes sp. TFC3]
MTSPAEAPEEDSFFLLMDPEWLPEHEGDTPPFESVVGLWPLAGDGSVGRFRSNPQYRPVNENSPSDPVDALLRLTVRGDAGMEQLQLVLRDSLVDQAMNGDGRPLIGKSPDGVPCVVIATSTPHRERIASPDWRRADLDEVVAALPDQVDVLLNPGGPATVRLTGDFIRATAAMKDDELTAARTSFRSEGDISVEPWQPEQTEGSN